MILNRKKLGFAVVGLGVFALVSVIYAGELFTGQERFLEDRLVSQREFSKEIVILSIDSESLIKIGQWPWPRSVFANIFFELERYKPRIVGVDVIWADRSRLGESDDAVLEQALSRVSYPIVLATQAEEIFLAEDNNIASYATFPLQRFLRGETVTLGHVNLILEQDGIVRSFPKTVQMNNTEIKAFAYEIVKRSNLPFNEENLDTRPRIVYSAKSGSIRRVPIYRIYEGENLENILKEKIIFIGATSPDLHDEKPTPLSRGSEMPGVEIQANIANMLLMNYRLAPLSPPYQYFWFAIIIFLAFIPFLLFKGTATPLIANVFLGALHNIVVILFFEYGFISHLISVNISWIGATGGFFAYRYFLLDKDRRAVKNVFSKYVSPVVLDTILKEPEKVELGGEERIVTVLFSDIRGFTTLSEKLKPTDLVRVLNKYFTVMTKEITDRNGILDKYIGDAIMAFWGAPLSNDNQCNDAFIAAQNMQKRLEELNLELKKTEGVEINTGIGLYTGPAVVGNIGSEHRFDYTVIGDTVNVASRLEGLCKEYKVNLVIGGPTKDNITVPANFISLGSTTVKGRVEPIQIYTVQR